MNETEQNIINSIRSKKASILACLREEDVNYMMGDFDELESPLTAQQQEEKRKMMDMIIEEQKNELS